MPYDPILQTLDEAIARAEAARTDLETEIRGLQLAKERRMHDLSIELPFTTREVIPADVAEWRELSRTDAVVRALGESEARSMHRKALTQRLQSVGRDDDSIEAVSAALAYLAREKRVTAIGQGWWRLGPPHDSAFSEAGERLVDEIAASTHARLQRGIQLPPSTTEQTEADYYAEIKGDA